MSTRNMDLNNQMMSPQAPETPAPPAPLEEQPQPAQTPAPGGDVITLDEVWTAIFIYLFAYLLLLFIFSDAIFHCCFES